MGLFSGGQSRSTSESFSGLRGTGYFNPTVKSTGSGYTFGLDLAKQRAGETNPFQLNASGLTAAQQNAFNTLGQQMFGNVSSNYASRGFLSPENVSGVVGSSLQQVAPQLMGQVFQNQMGQQQVLSDRFGQLREMLNTGTGLLGTQSKTESTQRGPNMLGSALAEGIGSWTNLNSYANMVKAANPGGK